MTKLTLNKSTYLREAKKLDSYEKYLPSLDLKRKQLLAEKAKARAALQALENEHSELLKTVQREMPMLANTEIDVHSLVSVESVSLREENRLGVLLPSVEAIRLTVGDYGALTRPHWVDALVDMLGRALTLKAKIAVQHRRLTKLDQAAKKATQRVNLVSKVLIPQAKTNLRKIKVFLADNERAAVVRAKIAKRKRQSSLEATR